MGLFDSTAETTGVNTGVNPVANLGLSGSGPGAFALPGGTNTISAGDDLNATVNTTNNVDFTLTDQGAVDAAFNFAQASLYEAIGLAGDVSADGVTIAQGGFDLVEYLGGLAESIFNSGQVAVSDSIASNESVSFEAIAATENLAGLAIGEVSDAYSDAGSLVLAGAQDAIASNESVTLGALASNEIVTAQALAEVGDAYANAGDLVLAGAQDALQTNENIALASIEGQTDLSIVAIDTVAGAIDQVTGAYQGAGELILDSQAQSLDFLTGRLDEYEQNAIARDSEQLQFVTGVVNGSNDVVLAQTASNESVLLESSRAITDNLKTALSFVRNENSGEGGLVVEVVKYVGLAAVGVAVAWGVARFAK